MHSAFKALALLAVVASASASSFKLKAHVTDNDLTPSIEGQEMSVQLNNGIAYLAQPGSGATFSDVWDSIDTDATGVTTHIHIAPGGTATVPSTNVIVFDTEQGTQGVSVATGQLAYANGAFTACPANILGQDSDNVLISFKSGGQRTLFGCADIILEASYQ